MSAVTVDDQNQPRREKGGQVEDDEDGADEERTEDYWSSDSPTRRNNYGACNRTGNGHSPGNCHRCHDLQVDLDEKDLECEKWRKRCESLAGEIRELQRAVVVYKRGGPGLRGYLHQQGGEYQALSLASDMVGDRERLDDLLSRPPKKWSRSWSGSDDNGKRTLRPASVNEELSSHLSATPRMSDRLCL